jgi:hypothetical protein
MTIEIPRPGLLHICRKSCLADLHPPVTTRLLSSLGTSSAPSPSAMISNLSDLPSTHHKPASQPVSQPASQPPYVSHTDSDYVRAPARLSVCLSPSPPSHLSTVTSLHMSRAMPIESKPGPKLADVAGTRTVTLFRSMCSGSAFYSIAGVKISERDGLRIWTESPTHLPHPEKSRSSAASCVHAVGGKASKSTMYPQQSSAL